MRRSERGGNSVYLGERVGIWWDQRDGCIHMTINDIPNGHVAISNNPGSRRGHPTLFDKLAQCLREKGAPSPLSVDSD